MRSSIFGAFIPSAFTSQFELHFTLAQSPGYVLQTNIARLTDIILPIPQIRLTAMMDEVGPSLFNTIRDTKYFTQPVSELHFVHVEAPSPIQLPILSPPAAQDVYFDLTKLTTKDVRSLYFFIASDQHLNASNTGAYLYNLDPFNFDNFLQINNFRFTIQNTNATIPQTDIQNRAVNRQFFSPLPHKNNLAKGFLYHYNFAEFWSNRNISSGSNNLNSKTNYNLVINLPPISTAYYLYIYFDTENLMTQQNSDIAPALTI